MRKIIQPAKPTDNTPLFRAVIHSAAHPEAFRLPEASIPLQRVLDNMGISPSRHNRGGKKTPEAVDLLTRLHNRCPQIRQAGKQGNIDSQTVSRAVRDLSSDLLTQITRKVFQRDEIPVLPVSLQKDREGWDKEFRVLRGVEENTRGLRAEDQERILRQALALRHCHHRKELGWSVTAIAV